MKTTSYWLARSKAAGTLLWHSSLTHQSSILMAEAVFGSLASFLFWTLASNRFSPEAVGLGAALFAAVGLASSLGQLGLNITLIRYYDRLVEKVDFIKSSLLAILIATGAIAALYAPLQFLPDLGAYSTQQTVLLLLMFLLASASFALVQFSDRVFIATETAHLYFTRSVFANTLKVALLYFSAVTWGVIGIMGALAGSMMLAFIGSSFLLIPRVIPDFAPLTGFAFCKQELLRFARYTLGNHLVQFLLRAPGFLLPVVVLKTLGATQNAYFYVAWMMMSVLMIVPNSVSTMALAKFSKTQRRSGMLARPLGATLLGMLPILLVVGLLSDILLGFFGASYASEARGVLLWLLTSLFPSTVIIFYITKFRLSEAVRPMLLLSGSSLFAAAVAIIFLGNWFGLEGIGAGWLLSQSVAACLGVVLNRQYDKQPSQHNSEGAGR